jgi:AraC-like DNA-binding protein
MTTGNLIAKIRAHRAAVERVDQARRELDEEITRAVDSGDWQIIDVAQVTGWSRETIRAIVNKVHKDQAAES